MKNLLFIFLIQMVFWGCDNNPTESNLEAPTDSLIAYYPFNMNILDESGNNHNGNNLEGCIPIDDRFGDSHSAFYFDGIDDYIELIKTEILFEEEPLEYSYSLWFKSMSWDFDHIFSDRITDACSIEIDGEITATIRVWLSGNYTNFSTHFDIENHFIWYNITLTASIISQNMKLYINGELKDIITNLEILRIPDNNSLIVGAENDNGNIRHFFNGIIDDIRIYDKELTSDEVNAIYHENGWN